VFFFSFPVVVVYYVQHFQNGVENHQIRNTTLHYFAWREGKKERKIERKKGFRKHINRNQTT